MRLATFGSILVLGIAGAAIAQVSTAGRMHGRMGNATMNNTMMNGLMMNDMAPGTPMNGVMMNATDPMPGNAVGTPTEVK